ncbi:isoleucine--tRNA ligase [Coemansia javaensis]|uniref:Isoleucine--tRNA ligase, cytoplasmic n=1 Tax=Coemansia javaensis TaxID=2761396 RepID=A0A9W8HGF3_9FUNG|nr:isoleucine--tRNA ligase [Coemansia javaensis]
MAPADIELGTPGATCGTGQGKPETPAAQRWLALLTAALLAFVAGYDFAAAAAALPVIGIKFSQYTTVNWVVAAHMIAMGVTLPSVRRLADICGHWAALVAFGLLHIAGAVMSGAARGIPLLLAGRALAGLGSAGTTLIPAMAVAGSGAGCQRTCNLRVLLAAWLIGSIVGIAVGGRLSSLSSWRYVFYIDAILVGVALLLSIAAPRALRRDGRLVDQLKRIDWLGSVFIAGSVLTMVLAMNYGGNLYAWASGVVIALLVLSVFLFVLFVFIERKMASETVLPPGLFQTRTSTALVAMQPFIGAAIYAPIVYLVIWYNVVKAKSSKDASVRLLALAASALVFASATEAAISAFRRCRPLLLASSPFLALGCGLLIILDDGTSDSLPIAFMVLLGIGIGTSLQPQFIAIWRASGVKDLADVVASVLFLRLAGAAVAVGMFNAILQNNLTTKLLKTALVHPLFAPYIVDSPNNPDIMHLPRVPQAVRDAVAHDNAQGFRSIFIAALALAAVPIPLLLFLGRKPPVRSPTTRTSCGTGQFSFPQEEEKVLRFWREIDAFKTSVKLSEGRKPFSFYDGPPFCTGLPHYGHLLAGTIKDIVTRFAHNTGHYVERRAGWDTHGLPIEYEIDKTFNISGRGDVLAMGIDRYNAECRSIVMRYAGEWRETVERLGRWIDFDNDYKTLNTSFMESEWWVFKQLFDKGLVYRGMRVMPYSTALLTTLSNFEAQQNYKEVSDPAVVVAFPLRREPEVSILAWTTTPWTLPSNCALCVNPAFEYVKIRDGETGGVYILLESCLGILYKDVKKAKFEVLERIKAQDLVGLEYEPVFDFFVPQLKDTAWRVVADPYVDGDSGTGIVHNAPAFGEDDYRVCLASSIIAADGFIPNPVMDDGKFDGSVGPFSGAYVKDADKAIMKHIKERGRLVRQGTVVHSYPFCWRSDTPLLYRAVPSWFVRVQNATDRLLKNSEETYWVPAFVKEKRFANWLGSARDWNVSRSRYWGTPIPLWVSEDFEEIVCVGSVAELEELTGASGITDLHRDKIDHLTIPSRQGKGVLRRIEDVFDCWFESGSMPYAQKHYPFENKELFEQTFPADFISEGIDQTRGWFYTLLVLSTLLFDKPAWKNLIASGLVLAADGKKMSKRLKNYPDPMDVLNKYGADPLRLYLINSPVVRAETLRFKEEGVKDIVSRVLLPWYNAFRFFTTQVAVLKKDTGVDFVFDPAVRSANTMDRWVLASVQSLIRFVREEMEAYRLYTVVPRLFNMIDQLTNWYVRFNRRRLKGEAGAEDTVHSLNTLFEVLLTLCRLMAPFTPFVTESMYQALKAHVPAGLFEGDARSLHFVPFPEVREEYFDAEIERAMSRMQAVIELGRVVRERKNISLKMPLRELVVIHPSAEYLDDVRGLSEYITEELRLRSLVLSSDEDKYGIKYRAEADFRRLGAKLLKDMPRVKKALPSVPSADVKAALAGGSLVVDGIALDADDINIVRFFDALSLEDKSRTYEEATDRDAVVLLDTETSDELVREYHAREVSNRVQRLRKKADLTPVDDVHYYYQITHDPEGVLAGVLEAQDEHLAAIVKQPLRPLSAMAGDAFVREEQEVSDAKFVLAFVRA